MQRKITIFMVLSTLLLALATPAFTESSQAYDARIGVLEKKVDELIKNDAYILESFVKMQKILIKQRDRVVSIIQSDTANIERQTEIVDLITEHARRGH